MKLEGEATPAARIRKAYPKAGVADPARELALVDQLWFTRTAAGTICLGNRRKHAREGATLHHHERLNVREQCQSSPERAS
jgi:hypothetical protein